MKLKYLENYLILIMSAVAVFCIYLLYRPTDYTDNNTQVIAKVIGRINIVKRKKDFFQSWKDTGSGDSLASNDEIYTHGNSFATIQFNNGNKLEVSENSLIKIKNSLNKNGVEINKGNIVAELNSNQKNLEIEIKGKKYKLTSENAKIQIEQSGGENKFILLEGSASIKNDKVSHNINENEILKENISTGSFQTKLTSASLISPKRKSIFYFDQTKEITFNWKNLSENQTEILIASDREFKNIVHQKLTSDKSASFNFQEEKIYYWKIHAENYEDSPINEFQLLPIPKINLRSNQNVFIKRNNSKSSVSIAWDKIKNLNNIEYQLNITKPDNSILEVATKNNHFELELDQIGKYLFRAKIKDQINFPNLKYGPEFSIILKNIESLNIESITPNVIDKVWYKNTKANTRLYWNSNIKTDYFIVKITHPNNTQTIEEVTNNFYQIDHDITGEYQWEIIGVIGDTKSNTLSGKVNFKKPLKLNQAPSKGAIIELDKPDQSVNFKWEPTDNSNVSYEIEISQDENFKVNSIKKIVTENKYNTALNELGTYFWRVKILNGDKTEYSEPTSIELRPIPPLNKPGNLPELKIKLKDEDKSSFIKKLIHFIIESAYADTKSKKAEWTITPNSKVKTYIIKIYNDTKGLNLVKTIESSDTHFIWSDSKPGTYYWSMAYVDFFNRQTEFSSLSKMEIIEESIAIENKPLPIIPPKDVTVTQKKIKQPEALPIKKNEAPILVSKEVIVNQLDYQFFITPQIYTINNDSVKKIEISGVNIESFEFTKYQKQTFLNYDESNFNIKFNRGKVFNKIVFNDLDFSFKLKRDNAIYKHGPKIFLSKNSKFQVSNNQVIAANQFNAILGYLGYYQLGKMNIEASAGFGTGLFLNFESYYQFNERYTVGIYFQSLSNNKQNNNYLGLKFGYNFFK